MYARSVYDLVDFYHRHQHQSTFDTNIIGYNLFVLFCFSFFVCLFVCAIVNRLVCDATWWLLCFQFLVYCVPFSLSVCVCVILILWNAPFLSFPVVSLHCIALCLFLIYFPCEVSHSTTCSMLVHWRADIGRTIQGVSMT